MVDLSTLPKRKRPRPPTHKWMPHTQIGITPVPDVHAELYRRSYSLPGVRNEPTQISVPGARALWLAEELSLARPELILVGREFAHIHPDGSLHVTLPPARARQAIEAGWAEIHPVAEQIGNEGMVLLYTPQDMEELEVVFQLILDSYNFVTGRSLQPAAMATVESGE